MAKPVSQTARERGIPLAGPPGPHLSPLQRRETAVRRLLDKYGSPLDVMARAMVEADTPRERLEAARALAPYVFPALKAVEVSGAGGERLTVEIRRAGPPSGAGPDAHNAPAGAPAPSGA